MRTYARPSLFSGMPGAGAATKWLCAALVTVSVVAGWSGRTGGLGADTLMFRTGAVLDGELWRLVSYAFVKADPFGLMISAVVLWLFGRWCEGSWGSGDYLRFFFASIVGAAVLAIPLSMLINLAMPFYDVGQAQGPDPAIDAMMVALALNAPDSNVLFGFVLPIPARTIIWLLLGMEVILGIMTGASNLSITLGGVLMGYFLVTGHWRPSYLFNQLRMRRLKKRRDGLYVVPPRNKSDLN